MLRLTRSCCTSLAVHLLLLVLFHDGNDMRGRGRGGSSSSLLVLASISGTSSSSSSSSSSGGTRYDFEKMSSLMKRLSAIENIAADTMAGFYDPDLKSFSVLLGGIGADFSSSSSSSSNNRKSICITSTCYAILTFMSRSSNTGTYDSILSFEKNPIVKTESAANNKGQQQQQVQRISIPDVVETLLASKWREGDLFQVPLLLYTILQVDDKQHSLLRGLAAQNKETAAKIRKLISIVLNARPHRGLGGRQEHSDYVSYQVCKVVGLLQESNYDLLPEAALPEEGNINIRSELFWVLQRSCEVSYNEMCRQLAYRIAGDSNSFDVIRLAYSLLTYIRGTKGLDGISGKEIVPGEGPAGDTKVAPLNQKLVKAALMAFFEEQNSDGLWDKGQPIYKNFKKGKGRTMDNAFVFPVNTVGSLLCAIPAEEFRPHLQGLERTLAWIESHQTVEMITTQVDKESGQCYGVPLRGWSSPHHDPDSGPKAWSTAQVLKCVSFMRKTISQLMHNDVLEEFHGTSFSKDGMKSEAWDSLLDSDLGNPATTNTTRRTLKSVMEERIVQPFENSIDNPSYGAAYSAVLFGPPGTAKTTICEALAKKMGYDFVVIDTAAFLADGLTNVSARIRYVFKRLMALRKCIILFDEIEEFCLDRETLGLSMESRMLTTAMLTAINDLRRKKQSLFFIATNRVRAFDSAITRPGRFDMQLFVGTPNLESRVLQFKQQLSSSSSSPSSTTANEYHDIDTEKAIESYRSFLSDNWSQDAMFMNYLEGVQFASACAKNLVVTSSSSSPAPPGSNNKSNSVEVGLTHKAMKAILQQQAAVMTVRGSTRDEFIASMEFSRF